MSITIKNAEEPGFIKFDEFAKLNQSKIPAAWEYAKAGLSLFIDDALIDIFPHSPEPKVIVNTRNYGRRALYAKNIIKSSYYSSSFNEVMYFIKKSLFLVFICSFGAFIFVIQAWSRFGKSVKSDKRKDDNNVVLTPKEVRQKLRSLKMASDLTIDKMPLVKDMETRHFLVSGSTGSGKTNLIHNLLPQIEKKGEPAIVIDNTGEMIAKYYNPERGDIIFNPFDSRGKAWDFWSDCSNPEELERFSKILFSFNRKRSGSNSDPFWEQSAEIVFNACVEYLVNHNKSNMSTLKRIVLDAKAGSLRQKLKGTSADRYLDDNGKGIASSVLSVLSTTAKPIGYLSDRQEAGKFSLKEHFHNIRQGSNAWLFLATKPGSRQLTQSIIACLTELALAQLMDIGIDSTRRVWFIIDELASLGKLPALPTLMSEGRKYGSCIICGMQSLNQLYSIYGQYEGSGIFGQFGTSFFFRNTESIIAKQVSNISGMETITRQQKNTSFGANEFRDGISYSEHQQKKPLIETSDLASLETGNCYVFLPEPAVRMAKIKVPFANTINKHQGFLAKQNNFGNQNNDYNENKDSGNADDSGQGDLVNNSDDETKVPAKERKHKQYLQKAGKTKQKSQKDKRKQNSVSSRVSSNQAGIKQKSGKRQLSQKQNIRTRPDNKLMNNI